MDNKFPDDTLREVFDTFLQSDRVTLIVSAVVLLLNLLVHFIIDFYAPEIRETSIHIPFIDISVSYIIASFILAFVLGYAGQRLVYKWLGKAEGVLNQKMDRLPSAQ